MKKKVRIISSRKEKKTVDKNIVDASTKSDLQSTSKESIKYDENNIDGKSTVEPGSTFSRPTNRIIIGIKTIRIFKNKMYSG